MRVDKKDVKLSPKNEASFWNGEKDSATLTVQALSDVTLRSVNLRFEPGIGDMGVSLAVVFNALRLLRG